MSKQNGDFPIFRAALSRPVPTGPASVRNVLIDRHLRYMKIPKTIAVVISALALAVVGACNFLDDPGKEKVKYVLKDAGSADFRNARKIPMKPGTDHEVFCGEVNSKNSYGALTGFKKYVVIDRLVLIEGGGISINDNFKSEPESLRSVARANAELELYILNQRAERKNIESKLANMRNRVDTKDTVDNTTPFDLAWDENCR